MPLTLNLPEEALERLLIKAKLLGVTPEQYAERLVDLDVSPAESPNLADRIAEIWADVPEDVLALLPTDGAHQHDHYLYGTPKKKD